MRATGGAIAVTAGIFATTAAIFTLVIGLAGALHAEQAVQISWSEWAAVVFSFAAVFLGAVCLHARSVTAGLLLMFAAVCGGLTGGLLVAMFMALTFVGGAIASFGVISDRELPPPEQASSYSHRSPLNHGTSRARG